ALEGAVTRCAFERAQGGCSDGKNPAARDGLEGLGGDGKALLVHAMRLDRVAAHRLEGSGPDMQREPRHGRAARLDRREERMVEVQAGGRRGHRARYPGVHGLVTLGVQFVGRMRDVGWERHGAEALEHPFDVLLERDAVQVLFTRNDDYAKVATDD